MKAAAPKPSEVSKVVAAFLSTEFGGDGVQAKHNSQVVYEGPDLKDLHVDCWPSRVGGRWVTRTGPSKFMTVIVAIQRHAETQEEYDILSDLADDIRETLMVKEENGSKSIRRFTADGVTIACTGAEFTETDMFDRYEQYNGSVFVGFIAAALERVV